MRCWSITHLNRQSSISTATKNKFMAMSNSSTDSDYDYDSDSDMVIVADIEDLHDPDGREIDVRSLLQHVKDIILFTNEEEQEEPVTSKEVPPLTWCKSLLVPLEKIMRDISMRDNRSAVAVSILKELLPYAWGAKAIMVLTSFAMNHGLWMLAQMYSASPPSLKVKYNKKLYSVLSRVLSKGSELDSYYFYLSLILSFSKRPKENTLPKPALTSLFQAIVRVVECIIELQDLPSEDLRGNVTEYETTMAAIPIIVYNVITMVIYCTAVINQFPNNDYEISEAEDNKLSMYASHINKLVNHLSEKIRDCNQFLEETKYDKEYQIPIPETSSTDNREALEYLIKSGDDPKLLNAADTIISQLKGKYVMLLVSDEDSSTEEILSLGQIYSQRGMKEQFSILWIPLYSGIGKERASRHFQTQIRNMNWYAIPHPSMVSKEATEFIKNKWRFQSKSNILVMLDPQGTVLNINAFHMIWIWGSRGFPFTRSRERALWIKESSIGTDFIPLDGIDPTIDKWRNEGKKIFLYGGDDIEWVRKFTTSAKRVSQKYNNIPVELIYVGKPSKGDQRTTSDKIKDMITREKLSHVFLDKMMTWFFWSRLRSALISKMSHQNRQESEDRMTRQLKWLLGYETERSWALLAKGDEVVTHGPGSTILQALMEYETKKEGGSFEDEFEKLHKKVVSSGKVCCLQVEFPVWSSGMPETMRCPQLSCKTDMMDKSIVFECCHHKLLPEK